MQLEEGKISSSELIFIIVGFTLGSSLLMLSGLEAKNMGWLAIIIGLIEGFGFAFIFTTLSMRFPGKNFVEITETVFGSAIGKLVALIFLGYLFHLGSLVANSSHDFIRFIFLAKTPSAIIMLFGILIIIYAVFYGIEVMVRVAQGMVILTVGLFILMFLLLINKMDLNNLLPLFNVPLKKFLWASHVTSLFPFGEIVAFLMIFPYTNQPRKIGISVFKGMMFGAVILFLASVRTILTLGRASEIFVYPFYQSGKLIAVAEVFTRLEIIAGIDFLMMGGLKIATLLYGTALGTAQLFNLKSYRPLVLPLGLLMGLVGMLNFPNVSENIKNLNEIYPIYAVLFILIIPLITLLVAIIRKLPLSKGNKE